MHGDVFLDGGVEFRDALEHATAQAAGGDVAEEALDHVQPRSRGWRVMNREARMFLQPFFHLGMFVRGVVIADKMQQLVFRGLSINLAQEIKPFSMTVTLLATRDDRSVQRVERGEQRGGAVAFVIVRHGGRTSFLQRQSGLGTIQGLNLAFFVAAQHQSMFWRGYVQAHNVSELLHKLWIMRDLEGLDQVRFQSLRAPMTRDARLTGAKCMDHAACAPLGRVRRCSLRAQRR